MKQSHLLTIIFTLGCANVSVIPADTEQEPAEPYSQEIESTIIAQERTFALAWNYEFVGGRAELHLHDSSEIIGGSPYNGPKRRDADGDINAGFFPRGNGWNHVLTFEDASLTTSTCRRLRIGRAQDSIAFLNTSHGTRNIDNASADWIEPRIVVSCFPYDEQVTVVFDQLRDGGTEDPNKLGEYRWTMTFSFQRPADDGYPGYVTIHTLERADL